MGAVKQDSAKTPAGTELPEEVECAIAAFAGAIKHPVPSARLYSRELAAVILAYGASRERAALLRVRSALQAEHDCSDGPDGIANVPNWAMQATLHLEQDGLLPQ
jgi:hypothetical protein